MSTLPACDFASFFADVSDPRIERSKAHRLLDILFISVAGTIAGCEGPSDIAEFARTQLVWCRKFVPLASGVPSHGTIGRVLSLMKPQEFQKAFVDWIATLVSDAEQDDDQPRFVPIDGKTLRGSHGARQREQPLHLVSAWATRQGMLLGQVAVDEKSNEITAIPRLLAMLELHGAIVGIDAMGCQKEIAQQIVAGGGNYVLSVKDNQPALHQAIAEFFLARHEQQDFADFGCRQHTTTERSRGREETRSY
jgi:predicted transposase YbfD/YdcC